MNCKAESAIIFLEREAGLFLFLETTRKYVVPTAAVNYLINIYKTRLRMKLMLIEIREVWKETIW